MADEIVTPHHVPSEEISRTLTEASKIDEPSILDRTAPNVSISSTTVVISPEVEINQETGTSSIAIEPSDNEPGSLPGTSRLIAGVSEHEQPPPPVEDNPTAPLLPRYKDCVPPITLVDDETYEPPPPPRPSLCQCMCCCCFINTNIHIHYASPFNIHFVRKIRNSNYMLLVLVALLAIPISSLYFGIAYKGSCPMAEFSPVLLIILGVIGVIFIGIRLMTICSRRRLWNMPEPPRTISIFLTLLLIAFMPMEMVNFYTKKPVFDNPKDHAYCEKPFYYYVFYMNFVVLIIGVLALLLHMPEKHERSSSSSTTGTV